jgi:hypothetical protein
MNAAVGPDQFWQTRAAFLLATLIALVLAMDTLPD